MPLEVVPVDLVASAILVVSALVLDGHHEAVYQLGTADVNPIELEPLVTLLSAESRRRRQKNGNRNAGLAFVERFIGARHGVPVQFVSAEEARARRMRFQKKVSRVEGLLACIRKMLETTGLPGKESLAAWTTALRTLGLQTKFREQTLDQYLPFILHNRYIFESENIRAAYSVISEKDRELLPWDPERIDWKDYWVNNQILGIEKWLRPEAVKDWSFRI